MGVIAPTEDERALTWDIDEVRRSIDAHRPDEALFWLESARAHAQAAGDAASLAEIRRLAETVGGQTTRDAGLRRRTQSLVYMLSNDLYRLRGARAEPEPEPEPAERGESARRGGRLWIRRVAVCLGLVQAGGLVVASVAVDDALPILPALVVAAGAYAAWRHPTAMGTLLVVVGCVLTLITWSLIDWVRDFGEENPGPWGFWEAFWLVAVGGIPLVAGVLLLVSAKSRADRRR